jgi:hypothetical protein
MCRMAREGIDPEPDVSVVVCSMGRPGIEDTVASIAASASAANARVETIVVWQSREPPPSNLAARVIEVFPAGLGLARNRGLAEARSVLVGFVDDDELVDGGWIAALQRALETPRIAAAFGPVRPRDERGLPYCRYDGGGIPRTFTGSSTPPWVVGTGGNMAFRTAALAEAGGFEPAFGVGAVSRSAEDSEVIVRLLREGRSIAWAPQMVVYHPSKTRAERLASRYPYAYGLGKVVRRYRDPMLAARYGRALAGVFLEAAKQRDRARWREGTETLKGFVAGAATRARTVAPSAALDLLPEDLRQRLDGVQVQPLPYHVGPAPHYLYRVGSQLLLHAYVHPQSSLEDAFAAREIIREQSRLVGIPRIHGIARGMDVVWLLEDWLGGAPPPVGDPRQWFSRALRWSEQISSTVGPPLSETNRWSGLRERLLASCPLLHHDALSRALDIVGNLPARHAHGDFQRKNVLLGSHGKAGLAVVDWEHAALDFLPGFDVAFLAVMARDDEPAADAVLRLARGEEAPWEAGVQDALRRVGVTQDLIKPWLAATLGEWAAREATRVTSLGFSDRRTRFGELFERFAPMLL